MDFLLVDDYIHVASVLGDLCILLRESTLTGISILIKPPSEKTKSQTRGKCSAIMPSSKIGFRELNPFCWKATGQN